MGHRADRLWSFSKGAGFVALDVPASKGRFAIIARLTIRALTTLSGPGRPDQTDPNGHKANCDYCKGPRKAFAHVKLLWSFEQLLSSA
jgi:hypothetical protein